jgi:pentatricopeptide repeat protein
MPRPPAAFAPTPALPTPRRPPAKRARPGAAPPPAATPPRCARRTLTVELPRPLGLVLEESSAAPRRVVVSHVDADAPAAAVVRVGDVVVATSATFGSGTWPARSLDGAVSAIRTRCGATVTLVLEREDGEAVAVAPPPERRVYARSRPLPPKVPAAVTAAAEAVPLTVLEAVEERLVPSAVAEVTATAGTAVGDDGDPPVDAEVEGLLAEFAAFRTRRVADALVDAATRCVRAAAEAPVPRIAAIAALVFRLRRAEAPLTLRFYNNLMWSYVRARAPARAVDIFDDLPNPNVECYTTLAKALGALRRPEAAVKLLAEMRARGVAPNVRTYNAVIAACFRGGGGWSQSLSADRALALFAEMQVAGIEPNVVTWNTLIDWHARQRKGADRLAGTAKAFAEMKVAGVQPNTVTYTTMMKSYASSGAINKAEGIFVEMKRRFPLIAVDTEAYNTLLTAHAARLDWRRCLELLDEMQLSGERGGVQLSDSYRREEEENDGEAERKDDDGFSRGGVSRSPSSSRNVLSNDSFSASVKTEHPLLVEPNAVSYALVIKACADSRRVEIAHTVFDEMLADGISPPPPHAVVSLLGGYASTGDFSRALDMLNRLKGWGIAPNLRMMCSLMNACLNAQQPDIALAIYAKIKASSTRPDVVAYTMLLRAYGAKGDLDKAYNVIKAMTHGRTPVPPNIVTYNALIHCANEVGRPDAALRALQMALADSNVHLNNNTFQAIVQRASVKNKRFYVRGELSTLADVRYDPNLIDPSEMDDVDTLCVDSSTAWRMEGSVESVLESTSLEKGGVGRLLSADDVGTGNIAGQSAREYLDYLMEATRIVRAAGSMPNGVVYVALLEACETCGDIALGVQLVAERRSGKFRVARQLASEARLYEETMRSRDKRSRVGKT